jgi:DNA-binding CsgD family transcriptional regulator/pimeloyl-ACP methyl ester carboxylesterase
MSDWETDLEAVLDALEMDSVVLFGGCHIGHVGARFAARHPERVAALILDGCSVSMHAWPQSFWGAVSAENWRFFLESLPPTRFPPDLRIRIAHEYAAGITPADWSTYFRALEHSDLSDVLPALRVPTLVLHARDFSQLRPEDAVALAALIPHARLRFVEGDGVYGDAEEGLAAIDEFLQEVLAPDAESGVLGRLSARQREVLQLLARGKSNREIADELVLSERTIERHVSDLYSKIGVRNRAEATGFALSKLSRA